MKKYLTDWGENFHGDGADLTRVVALEPEWNLAEGWHPDIDIDNSFYDPQVRRPMQPKSVPHMPPLIAMRPEGVATGHVMMKDSGVVALTQPDKSAPIAPLFVRDLAGRVIYIGTVRHKQAKDEKRVFRMPQGSDFFDENREGYPLLERIFFCSFRALEFSDKPLGEAAGTDMKSTVVSYYAPNLYPYKLRLDTFYQDGWRLPLVEKLYVVPVPERHTSERASSQLFKLWETQGEEPYETFLEKHEEQLKKIFNSGCTLIPTVEAFNGVNQLDDDYNHVGFWPGRAVPGLHEIVSQEPNDAPAGTILKVLEPGFVTDWELRPARVVVSDGQKFASSQSQRYNTPIAKRQYPDLRLPHQRTSSKWGSVWVPQHPADFEEPAIWGWEASEGGRFVQLRGPIWDPLHYYYGCTSQVVEAHAKNRLRKNVNLVRVPDEMLGRFYPVVEMQGFDSMDMERKKEQLQKVSLVPTSLYRCEDPACLTRVGYHPMPSMFEYELDNWWFPDLAPKYRVSDVIPLNIESKLVEVIAPNISPDRYLPTVRRDSMAPWASDPLLMSTLRNNPEENYPYLLRYLKPETAWGDIVDLTFIHLEGGDMEEVAQTALPTGQIREMENNWPGLYQLYLACMQKAALIKQQRHKMYVNDINAYGKAFWSMVPLAAIFDEDAQVQDPKKSLPASAVYGSAEY